MTNKSRRRPTRTHNVGIPRFREEVQEIMAYGKMIGKTVGELMIESFDQVHGDQMKIIMSAKQHLADGRVRKSKR